MALVRRQLAFLFTAGSVTLLAAALSCGDEAGTVDSLPRGILDGVVNNDPPDGRVLKDGAPVCAGSGILASGGSGSSGRYILTASHCMYASRNPDTNTISGDWRFEFTNLPGKPTVVLTGAYMSCPDQSTCLDALGDFAVLTFIDACPSVPASGFSAVAAAGPSTGDTVLVHGIRRNGPDGGPLPGDNDGKIYAANATVTSTRLRAIYTAAVTISGDSGGRVSVDGVAVGVASNLRGAVSGLSRVTSGDVTALLAGTFSKLTPTMCTATGPLGYASIPSGNSDAASDAGCPDAGPDAASDTGADGARDGSDDGSMDSAVDAASDTSTMGDDASDGAAGDDAANVDATAGDDGGGSSDGAANGDAHGGDDGSAGDDSSSNGDGAAGDGSSSGLDALSGDDGSSTDGAGLGEGGDDGGDDATLNDANDGAADVDAGDMGADTHDGGAASDAPACDATIAAVPCGR